MDYKAKYEEALERFKHFKETYCTYGELNFGDVIFDKTGKAQEELDSIFPELRESEEERVRKHLIEVVELYWGKTNEPGKAEDLAWLEKHKEPETASASIPSCVEVKLEEDRKPVEPSIDELQRHEEEFYNFKVFAAKQAKEYHISFVHDFEWNNFCAELLSYFNEKQKPVDTTEIAHCINCPVYEKAEWTEEDEKMLVSIINDIKGYDAYVGTIATNFEAHKKRIAWLNNRLKFLRPQPKQEWTEEDEKMLTNLMTTVRNAASDNGTHISEELFRDYVAWCMKVKEILCNLKICK